MVGGAGAGEEFLATEGAGSSPSHFVGLRMAVSTETVFAKKVVHLASAGYLLHSYVLGVKRVMRQNEIIINL